MSGSTTWPAGIPTPTDSRVSAALASWASAADPDNPAGALAAVVARVASQARLDLDLTVEGTHIEPDAAVLAVSVDAEVIADAGPWLPGFAREVLLSSSERRRGGVHHTSPAMARALVDFVTEVRPFAPNDVVLDPAVGGGVFLLAVAEALDGARVDRVQGLRGIDIDPLAVATTEASLRLWAEGAALPADAIRVGNALDDETQEFEASVVIGNPPFLSQLRDGTMRDAEVRASLAQRWPELRGYVDDAVAFLLAGVDAVGTGGVVALVQPSSVLSARDAQPVRQRLLDHAPPVGVWIDGGRQFSASVDTIALVLQKGAVQKSVQRARGVPSETLPPHEPVDGASWGSLLLVDGPEIPRNDSMTLGATLGAVAHVTAGFRDQFYGLRGAVNEQGRNQQGRSEQGRNEPKLITSGLIDPLESRWGVASCRFDKVRWESPTVDPESVDPSIRGWVADRMVPKLLVASQTKVLEVIIDRDGEMVPCTPVITVEPADHAPSLAHLAAALTSPVVSLLLLADAAGSALSADAMRVSARALAALPMPAEGRNWDAAAAAVEALDGAPSQAELLEIGRLGLAAYGLSGRVDIANWWQSRLRRR